MFEKLVYSQLSSCFPHIKLLSANQFGFRKNLSTSNAIFDTLRYIYNNLDSGHFVISIILDFAKAFDSVDHKILLQRMSMYGVRGDALDRFRSYLTQREKCESKNDISSGHRLIEYGVSHGFIPAPLLILMLIKLSFSFSFSFFFNFTLFADDSS